MSDPVAAVSEELDRERKDLVSSVLVEADEVQSGAEVLSVRQLAGGWSRWSYVATARDEDGERRFVIRVKAPSGLFDTDIAMEYDIFRGLEHLEIPTPRAFGLERSPDNPFGGEFFFMEMLPGWAPNVWRGADRAKLEADWADGRGIARGLVQHLAAIHSVGSADIPESLPTTDFATHVGRWRDAYESNLLVRDPVMDEAFVWLSERTPADARVGLVHGDYRTGNLLVDEGRVTAVLDWELAFAGDVRFDLGYLAMQHMAGKHLRPRSELLGAVADRDWFFDEYQRLTGADLDLDVVRTYSVLGLASLAAMIVVGIRRYKDGGTDDVRRVWARYGLAGYRQEMAELMGW